MGPARFETPQLQAFISLEQIDPLDGQPSHFLKRIAGLRGVALKLRPVKGLDAALVGDIKQSADQRCFSATFRDVPTSGEKRHQHGNKQDS